MLSREAPKTDIRAAFRGPNSCGRVTARTLAFVATLATTALVGCGSDSGGFQPLYGPTTNGQTYDQRLATVDIAPIPGRVGQRIRNELIFQRSTGNDAKAPELRLDIAVTDSVLTTLVNNSGTSSSQVYQLEARFQLIDLKTKAKVFEGRSLGRGSFDRFESIYANVRAREDSENRVAKSVAEDVRARLLAYLSRPK